MRRSLATLLLGALLSVSSLAFAAQGSDPVLGSWTLNVAKSTGAALPRSDTRTYAHVENGIKFSMKRVTAEGKEVSAETTLQIRRQGLPFHRLARLRHGERQARGYQHRGNHAEEGGQGRRHCYA